MAMTPKQWMEIRGRDRLLQDINDQLLTVYGKDQYGEPVGLGPGDPLKKGKVIWEDDHRIVLFDRLDDDARMWVETFIKDTGRRIPMECKYNTWDRIYRFMEEGAGWKDDAMFFSGFNTISFSFRKDGDPDAGPADQSAGSFVDMPTLREA